VLPEHLATPRLRLRAPHPVDTQAMFEGWTRDEGVTHYLSGKPHGDDGHEVDLHPVLFDAHGQGTQASLHGNAFHYPPEAFARGTIADRPVPCLSVEQQATFHAGYPLRAKEQQDLARLAARFGVRAQLP